MERLRALTRPCVRSGRKFLVISQEDLLAWAQSAHLSLPQATRAALAEGVFPVWWERNFPSFSAAEQLRLFDSAALVAGLGGLGGALATLLARVGVGRLLVADGDRFTPSNLNRQLLATQASLGRLKAVVAAEHLRDLNPALEVEAMPQHLTPDNLPILLSQVQVVLDGLDSLAARRNLFAAARLARVPLVHGAAQGVSGQVATIRPDDADAFSAIYAHAPVAGATLQDILAPTAALIAALQVQEAVRLLLGRAPAYHGRLAFYDGEVGALELLPLS